MSRPGLSQRIVKDRRVQARLVAVSWVVPAREDLDRRSDVDRSGKVSRTGLEWAVALVRAEWAGCVPARPVALSGNERESVGPSQWMGTAWPGLSSKKRSRGGATPMLLLCERGDVAYSPTAVRTGASPLSSCMSRISNLPYP